MACSSLWSTKFFQSSPAPPFVDVVDAQQPLGFALRKAAISKIHKSPCWLEHLDLTDSQVVKKLGVIPCHIVLQIPSRRCFDLKKHREKKKLSQKVFGAVGMYNWLVTTMVTSQELSGMMLHLGEIDWQAWHESFIETIVTSQTWRKRFRNHGAIFTFFGWSAP